MVVSLASFLKTLSNEKLLYLSIAGGDRLLAPIEMLRRELARIDTGGGGPPLDLRNEEDVSRVKCMEETLEACLQALRLPAAHHKRLRTSNLLERTFGEHKRRTKVRRLADDRLLRESGEAWMETMLGGLADAVIVVSRERKVLSLNRPAGELLGRSHAELQGEPLSEILPKEHPLQTIVDDAFSRNEAVGPRSVPLEVGGVAVPHTLTAQPLGEADVFGVMVSARDMEKLSRLGSHLSYSQKLAALGRLTSGVAHEIKNPLNAMVIHVALLRQKLEKAGPEAKGYLDVLEEEIRRLDGVIQGFLKFTRPEELQIEAVTVEEIVGEATRLLVGEAEKKGIRLETKIAASLPAVYGDRELLQQAFLNLMLNACEAMPDGGELRVTASRPAEGRVELDVEDSGVGIEPDELPKIFDLYYTTKGRGSGIGLSMVYRIVQLHDGDVKVSSTPGQGTHFTVTLPEVVG